MKKLQSNLVNMFLVLTVIALLSAGALAATYGWTAPILEEQARQRQIAAIAEVIPPFDNAPNEEVQIAGEHEDIRIFPGRNQGNSVGAAVQLTTNAGYGGPIDVMVGFAPDGTVTGITILRHQETPGLGARITDSAFRDQYTGQVLSVDFEVDSITAATISSRAVTGAVIHAWHVARSTGSVQ